MRRGSLLVALVLLAGASSAGACAAVVTGPHAEAAAFVKRCQAAVDKVGVGPVWKVHVARVRTRVATAVVACNSKGRMTVLTKASPSDRGLADAAAGEAGMLDGLANFRKYLTDVATGKSGHEKILTYATGEIQQSGVLLGQVLLELK